MLNTNIEDVPNFIRISPTNMKKSYLKNTLREKCPTTEFFLVRIFPHSDQKKLPIWTLFTQCYLFSIITE